MFGKVVAYNIVKATSYTYSIKACLIRFYKSGYYFDIIPWLGYRIQQAKINMHPTHNRAYADKSYRNRDTELGIKRNTDAVKM